MEEFGGKAYRMGKGSKDDAVVALLKDQLDEFKQVCTVTHGTLHLACKVQETGKHWFGQLILTLSAQYALPAT